MDKDKIKAVKKAVDKIIAVKKAVEEAPEVTPEVTLNGLIANYCTGVLDSYSANRLWFQKTGDCSYLVSLPPSPNPRPFNARYIMHSDGMDHWHFFDDEEADGLDTATHGFISKVVDDCFGCCFDKGNLSLVITVEHGTVAGEEALYAGMVKFIDAFTWVSASMHHYRDALTNDKP